MKEQLGNNTDWEGLDFMQCCVGNAGVEAMPWERIVSSLSKSRAPGTHRFCNMKMVSGDLPLIRHVVHTENLAVVSNGNGKVTDNVNLYIVSLNRRSYLIANRFV